MPKTKAEIELERSLRRLEGLLPAARAVLEATRDLGTARASSLRDRPEATKSGDRAPRRKK